MPVFKTYFKILNKRIAGVLIYLVIFILISFLMVGSSKESDATNFEPSSISLGFIDRDNSQISTAIKDYLSEFHNVTSLVDKKEVMQDELYYRNVSYILIIPEDFEEHFVLGTDSTLECIKVPNSNSGIYVDLQIDQLLKTMKIFITAGYNIPSAIQETKDVLSTETAVTLALDEATMDIVPDYYYFYKYVPYILTAIMIEIISYNLYIFNKLDIRRRNICSALSLKNRNLQMALASFISSFAVYLIITVIALLLYQQDFFQSGVLYYYFMNSFTYLIVSMSLGYLVGIIADNLELISAIGTISSLGLSFLGGIFVPLSIMSPKIKPIAKFVPTYWYTIANDTLMKLTKVPKELQGDIRTVIYVQLLFALAFICIALLISKKKVQQA